VKWGGPEVDPVWLASGSATGVNLQERSMDARPAQC
jgi:hypothetical protein